MVFFILFQIASEHHHSHISAHGPWDGRLLADAVVPAPAVEQYQQIESAQNMAYKGYA